MRTKKVTRHYCDHCSKGMFKKDAMERHESVCYRNRDRKCHRCQFEDPQYSISPERRKAILEGDEKCQTKKGECPDCLMAMVIQHNTSLTPDIRIWDGWVQYDKDQFNADRDAWDAEIRDMRNEESKWRYM